MPSSKSEIPTGFTLVRERIPRVGTSVDELMALLKRTLTENKTAQTIVLRAGQPYVLLEKLVSDAELPPDHLSLHDSIRAQRMEEYLPEGEKSSYEQVFEMFKVVEEEGFQVSHIVVSQIPRLAKWVKLPRKGSSLFGVQVYEAPEVPEDVILVCGSVRKDAGPDEIEFSVRGELS